MTATPRRGSTLALAQCPALFLGLFVALFLASGGHAQADAGTPAQSTLAKPASHAGAAKAAKAACDNSRINPAALIPGVRFGTELPPHGPVCFVARVGANPAMQEPHYTRFELWAARGNAIVLPDPPRALWQGDCKVLAVAFPRLERDGARAIAIMGRCNAADDERPQTVVYRRQGGTAPAHYQVDMDLSLAVEDATTLAEVSRLAKKALAARR